MKDSLIEIKNINKNYGDQQVLRDVSLYLNRGETLSLVGESGCGKTTLGRCLLGLTPIQSGSIYFRGQNITNLGSRNKKLFHQKIQMIFQNPFSSLNPRMPFEDLLEEPLIVHNLCGNKQGRKNRIIQLLDQIGLAKTSFGKFPHEFSGGQLQRIAIARAIAAEPEVIVCDEPVTALDLSLRAQIINLLLDLQRNLGLSYLFIAHDLKLVGQISDRVAVLNDGQIVESGPIESIFKKAQHPFTQALLASKFTGDPKNRSLKS